MAVFENDLLLAKRAAKGDGQAFEEIVKQNQTFIYNICIAKLGSREDALDVSQETFIKAYRSIDGYRGDSKLSSWLYRVCINCVNDHMRRSGRPTVPIDPDDEGEGGIDLPDRDVSSDPELSAERGDLRDAVRAAVDSLPDEQRELIILREYRDMSYAEISELLGVEEGTVKSRINRARNKIKNYLIERNFFP